MCNIAGYAGNKQAAPILLEMLRRQQAFDGHCSTGIATVHEGKLYYRKFVGDVDGLIKNTDALDLPGTIGIAHSRSSGEPGKPLMWELAHPYISMDETMALVSNGGSPRDQYTPRRDAAVQKLDDANYVFQTEAYRENSNWPKLKNGNTVGTGEVRVHLVDYYLKQGMSYTAAMAATAQELYTDNVIVMLNQNAPDEIFACRTVRPMEVLLAEGETYLSTCVYGFPKDVEGRHMSLPLFNACSITRGGVNISKDQIIGEIVDPVNPKAYELGRKIILAHLHTGTKENPVAIQSVFDSLVPHFPELFPGKHTFNEQFRLAYDILCQIMEEGELKHKVADIPYFGGTRKRFVFWFE